MAEAHTEQLLADAIKVLNHNGWTQGKLIDEQGNVCALGALAVARRMNVLRAQGGGKVSDLEAQQLLSEELAKAHGDDSIPCVNDQSCTTQEDIMLGFKRALHRAQEGGTA